MLLLWGDFSCHQWVQLRFWSHFIEDLVCLFFSVIFVWFWCGFFCFLIWVSDNLVGKGGYAEVYRGTLEDGEAVAVKRLTKASTDERKEKEFLTEIGTIGHVCHPNVSSLLGCCIDNGLYLIFQFFSRGSVSSVLHGKSLRILSNGSIFFWLLWSIRP